MNHLGKSVKRIKSKHKNQRINSNNSFVFLAILGIAIGGVIVALVAESCLGEIRNTIISNTKDIDGNIDEDVNIARDEIKQTLEKADDKSVGDVGAAMEKAFEELEDEDQNENVIEK